jgi:hypothetical protein
MADLRRPLPSKDRPKSGGLYGFTLDQSGFEERIDASFVELDASRNFYKSRSRAATSGARVSADGI